MIHEIEPKVFNNNFNDLKPQADDFIMFYDRETVLCKIEDNYIIYPSYKEIQSFDFEYLYLFSIDDKKYFTLNLDNHFELVGYEYQDIALFRTVEPKHSCFAGMTGYHLYNWYKDNKFCGRCGDRLLANNEERQLKCQTCGNFVYPHISPVVIVGILNGNKILMSKYANRPYKDYALIAGFTEIGETIEETVKREVFEEVGLNVKDITYYKSQPWAYSESLLLGFWANVEGSSEIKLDNKELSEADWFAPDDIKLENDNLSLTREMIMFFKENSKIFFKKTML